MTKLQKTIIITGANGLVGAELVRHFADLGYKVRALVRTPSNFTNNASVTYFAYDMTRDVDDEVFSHADYLVHTAYVKDGPNILQVNIDAAKLLRQKSATHRLKRSIFMSSMSANKNAASEYGRQKYQIEQLFNTKSDTVIRSGLVIGDGGLAKQVIDFMRTKHIAPLIGGGKQPIQIISVQDLARVIESIITKNVSGRLNIGTPRVYTYKEFYQAVKKNLHIKALLISVPFFVPLAAIRLIHLLHLPFAITEDNLQGLKQLRAYETRADLKKLGVTLSELDQLLG